MSSSGMGRDVHSLMLSIQHFTCRPRRRPPSKVLWGMVLERLLWLMWRVTCLKHARFHARITQEAERVIQYSITDPPPPAVRHTSHRASGTSRKGLQQPFNTPLFDVFLQQLLGVVLIQSVTSH